MTAIVIPFRAHGKSRLRLDDRGRRELAYAMLLDVIAACLPVGPTTVVTEDESAATLAREVGAVPHPDPGGGQGVAVSDALAALRPGRALVVNADVPCATPSDLRALLAATPPHGIAFVRADDGTTNALSLSSPALFAPLYGARSSELFAEHARTLGADALAAVIPNLADDVDDAIDLRRVGMRAGPRTQAALATLGLAA